MYIFLIFLNYAKSDVNLNSSSSPFNFLIALDKTLIYLSGFIKIFLYSFLHIFFNMNLSKSASNLLTLKFPFESSCKQSESYQTLFCHSLDFKNSLHVFNRHM